jgi:hypothetical protein
MSIEGDTTTVSDLRVVVDRDHVLQREGVKVKDTTRAAQTKAAVLMQV